MSLLASSLAIASFSVPIQSASLCPSLPQSLTLDRCGSPSMVASTVVSNLCASQLSSSCLTAAFGASAGFAAFFAGAATAAAEPSASTIIANVRCPAFILLFFRSTGEPALNRSGGQDGARCCSDQLSGPPCEGFRVHPAEQGFHAAVPAELQRMGARLFGHRRAVRIPHAQDI